MTKREQKIEKLIDNLQCSHEEALDIIENDKLIDRGKHPFPLSEEQEKVSKESRIVAGDIKQRAKPNRIKKVNNDKIEIMNLITKDLDNLVVINPEREVEFYYNNKKYKIVLSMPRK